MTFNPRNPDKLSDAELQMYLEDDVDDEEFNLLLQNAEDEEDEDIVEDLTESEYSDEDEVSVHNDSADANDSFVTAYTSKNGSVWSKLPIRKSRKLSSNIIKCRAGLTRYSSNFTNILDAFVLFVTPEIIEIIVKETNRKANYYYQLWNAKYPSRTKTWKATDHIEINAYIGIIITMGAVQASHEPIDMLWTTDKAYCRPIFPAVMSKNRFKVLTSFMRFDNFETREIRREQDRLAPIREIFDKFVENCKAAYNPGTHLTIDEQLVGFRGRAPFRVYMRNKPDKYGLKIWALVDCDTSYVGNLQVYLGKQGNTPEKGQGERVVLDMVECLKSGHGVTTDNFFTNFSLAHKLLEKKITICGTLKQNKPFIPNELLPQKSKPLFSTMFAFQKDVTLASYVPKVGKAVIMLSTEHHDDAVTDKAFNYKPDIIIHYNKTKGAVDAVDKMAKQYTTRRKSNRWPMIIFGHLLDMAGINSYKLWKVKHPGYENRSLDSRRKFLLDLGKQLVKENVTRRYLNSKLPTYIKKCMEMVLPELQASATRPPPSSPSQGRCYLCDRNKDRKSRQHCIQCNNYICAQHSKRQTICEKCSK